MKFNKYIQLFTVAALSVSIAACTNNDFSYDPSWLDGEEEEHVTDDPTLADEPVYDFEIISKNVKIDANTRYQVFEGFGASDCWLPNKLGEYWTNTRGEMAKLLFSQEVDSKGNPVGIGLSTWRVNLGAGTEELGDKGGIDEENANNRAPSYVTVSSTASNLTYDWTKCAGQRYFMEQAKNMGVESFVLFSNSPLVQFTKNGKGKSNAGANANIKDDYYDDYAEYMATVAEHFVKEGYNISHISPVNEPQYNWNGSNQEGSGWKNTQVARLARELDKALGAKGINTKISLGEAGHWTATYQGDDSRENTIENFFKVPEGDVEGTAYVGDLARLDNISAHSYYTDGNWKEMREVRQRAADAAAAHGVKLWQTEWSMLVNGPNHYGDILDKGTPWTIAQWMSAVIHNDITVAGVTAWHFWTALSVERWSQMDRFMLINCIPDGGNYSNDFTKEGKIEDFRTLWALGNYSRFIRPGYQRIDLNMVETENAFGTAWISPDNKTVVIVMTNRQKDKGLRLKVPAGAFPSELASIKKYTTTDVKNLEAMDCDINFSVICEPSSITTIVYTLQ